MRAYVLTRVSTGQEWDLIEHLRGVPGVLRVDFTFGPYDVIAEIEGPDLASVGALVSHTIRCSPGVIETMTCLAVE